MSLTPEITAEQIDDWFRIGKKSAKVQCVSKSTTGGRFIDPETLKPKTFQQHHVPHYKRKPTFHGGSDYATQYQREEDEKLISRGNYDINDTMSVVSSHMEALEMDSTIAGSNVLPSDLAPSNATEVYSHFDFTPNQDDKLPISKFREQVTATVESNQVTVIQGSTGSGKTTQVAQYILDHYAQQNKYCSIIVTQPRRIAAISIARRVCQERGWQLGTVCGYQVGLDKTASPDTRILYCTTGILLNKLINEKNMHQYTHVILDEVHERDQDTDFSLLVVRKLLRTNSRHTRVILMSATFDSDMFAQYFSLPVRDKLEQAPVVNVEGKPFVVKEYFAEDLVELGEIPPLDESDPDISHEARNLALKLIEQFDIMEAKEQGKSHTGFAHIRGTVLVFLPGLGEINALEQALATMRDKHGLYIIPLHSTITMDEQRNVFSQPPPGQRKVILSTNIAESSITVPDIKYVIDFCLTKNLVCDFDTNYTSLQVSWASKSNCIQRKGRAGRMSNGRVYRLVTRYFYENLMDYGIPEMQRCPLDKLILKVKVLDLGEPKAILALALSPPNLDDIERNILLLKEVGALTTSTQGDINRHDGELTFVGRVLADLPLDIRISKLLMLGHVFGLLHECLIIGAAMSLKNIFSKPFKQRLEAYRHKLGWAAGSESDSLAILNAYRTWEIKRDRGEFRRSVGGGEKSWCNQHFLQIRRLKEVSELILELEKRLATFNIERPKHEPRYKQKFSSDQEALLLKLVICGAFYPNYFVRGDIDEMESLKALAGKNPLNTVMVKGLPANQGLLYKQAVEDLFRRHIPNPQATFEETRAYVEFPWKFSVRTKIHEGVYIALKMKQLRMPLTIDLYSDDDARQMIERLRMVQGESESGALRSNRLESDSSVIEEPGTGRTGRFVAHPNPNQEFIKICITEVIECGHFWAQYRDHAHCEQLCNVQVNLNRDRGTHLQPFTTKVRVGMFCVAPFVDETLEYYRARVLNIYNGQVGNSAAFREVAEVLFVDYGNIAELPIEELRQLPNHLLKAPFQALEYKLIKIRPSPIRCPDGKWTAEATEAFKKMVINQELYARTFSIVHGVVRAELVCTAPFQIYISQMLIENGFADEAEESNLSKQSNEQRQQEYGKMRSQGQGDRRQLGGAQWSTESHRTLSRPTIGDGRLSSMAGIKRGTKVNLTGPSNPYEMSFCSVTNVGRIRSVKVEQDSVNSVAIDDEPYNTCQRLMVAGFVGLNPTGSSVMARDTTIMPLLPGLAAIIALIFTPVAELRADEKKTRYTGALCGLGTDPETGNALLPDNDMEMLFETKMDLQDIYTINDVRLAINFAIGSQTNVAGWGPDALYKIQDRARTKIMELIQRRREPIKPENPCRMYAWDQIDPDDILPHTVTDRGTAHLLSLHSGINLECDDLDTSETTAQNDYLLRHLRMLREVVKKNSKRTPTLCELCNITCPSPQLLALHMETQKHKSLESGILGDTPR